MFTKVLIANRGAIACRIIRTLRKMGIRSVAVYSEADRHSLHVEQADEAVCIGPPHAAQSYLAISKILEAARQTGAEAIHPGYGFLSENAKFAEACAEHGIVFIGPTPQQMRDFGLKHTARQIAAENGVPMLPGSGLLKDALHARKEASRVGYSVMLKSTAGGGGIGMRLCHTEQELTDAFEAVTRQSHASFGSGNLYLERFVSAARHIEVQIFGDGKGSVIALGERDCSVQRRNQKVIEETPAPNLPDTVRQKLLEAAVRLGKAIHYQSAGTVEFIYDNDRKDFYFLEVNTRLQVEHGVTEEVTGVDLVEWMVRQAAGEMPPLDAIQLRSSGHSIQVRVYAEDAARNFQPSAGLLTHVQWPTSARVETWADSGTEVTPFYDPMLAKVIVHGKDRHDAMRKLQGVLDDCELFGIETNLPYLKQVCAHRAFETGGVTTSFLRDFPYDRRAIDVLEPGTQTTVQDFPGRLGYWHVGVPPSGPIDPLAFRLANRLVGNPEDAAGLEITLTGPILRFTCDTTIALTGADFGARLDGHPIPRWHAVRVNQDSLLELGSAEDGGARAYLAVAGGIDAPLYLNSRSTFILGKFGGGSGRVLRAGDVLHIAEPIPRSASSRSQLASSEAPLASYEVPLASSEASLASSRAEPLSPGGARDLGRVTRLMGEGTSLPSLPTLATSATPRYAHDWEIGVLYGPHGAPDFFTPEDIEMFFSTAWKVHYNSDRTGIRLIGPKPGWARKDGGEAGLHPSNIHDNAYAIGTIDFTGDMPVILGPDGPSLGGFVCPATIVEAERWKMGQLKAGDFVRFRALTHQQAEDLRRGVEQCIETLSGSLPHLPTSERESPIVYSHPASGSAPAVVCRADGDRYLLIEYGPNVLDLNLRCRVHALEQRLRAMNLPGIIDITPGVRSMHIHYSAQLRREELVAALDACEQRIPDLDDITVESRVVHLPLSWDDPATQLAIRKYMQSVRPDAPWCPSNIEFIRRINGLNSIDDVHRTVFGANYLTLGLGDVYLGAPVATPVDPRHRLVTTKYNPARTWTAENSVGIGGAYLCVYGMEGPGGYQFVGRTLQMWNTYRSTAEFPAGTPWLLRFFDELRFYPVTADELLEIRDAFPRGRYPLRIEPKQFCLREYHAFLQSIKTETAAFKKHQQAAFEAERERWAAAGKAEYMEAPEPPAPEEDSHIPEGCRPVRSPIVASVWNVAVEQGQRVEAGQKLVVLEAMKTEIAIAAPHAGIIERLTCAAGAMVLAGQTLLLVRAEAG